MRAKEFLTEQEQQILTLTIPISINLPSGGVGGTCSIAAPAGTELPDQPIMVPPLQQTLELEKQQGGKRSRVINQIVASDDSVPRTADKQDYYNVKEDFDELVREFDLLAETAGGSGKE